MRADISTKPRQFQLIQLAILLLVSLLVRVAYLSVKPTAAVSLDVNSWLLVVRALKHGINPYALGELNWPPMWLMVIMGLDAASRVTGIGFVPLLWTFLITCETLLIAATFRLLLRFVDPRTARNVLLVSIALNPAAIFQVTQHGNFDVFMELWVVLGIDALIRFAQRGEPKDWLAACAWLGLGALTKTIPLMFWPFLFAGARRLNLRAWLAGALLFWGPVIIGVGIIMATSPDTVWDEVIFYHSLGGYYGITGLLALSDSPVAQTIATCHLRLFELLLIASTTMLAMVLWRRGWKQPRQIVLVAGLGFLSLPTLGSGFGSQYIYWFLPLLAIAWAIYDDRRWRRSLWIAYFVVVVTYMISYVTIPSHGNLLRLLYPFSDLTYAITLWWMVRAHEVFVRIPMLAASIGVLVVGVRLALTGGSSSTTRSAVAVQPSIC